MKKITIADNLYQYQFPPRTEKQHFGFNIFTLIDNKDALLIDAAFEDHASAVKADLSAMGIEPRKIIISHFHEDHFLGLRAFPNLQIFGSGSYRVPEEYYTPTDILSDASALKFGNFDIRFCAMPGHSTSDIFTIINKRFVHVGDDIVCSNENVPLLPFVEYNQVSQLIAALEKLKEYKSCTLLLGHGNPISGESVVLEAIDNRIKYLQVVLKNRSYVPYEEATKECTCNFLHKEWHEALYS